MDRKQQRTERGRRAAIDRRTGEVHGSGSGAGGSDPREDFDQDPMGGGGADPAGGPRPADDAARRPVDKHQGQYG